jgi:hypothetical protein
MSLVLTVLLFIFASVTAHAQGGLFDGFNAGAAGNNASQPGFGFLFGEQPTVENKRPRIIIRSPKRRSVSTKPIGTHVSSNVIFCVRTCDGFYFRSQSRKLNGGIEGQKKICKALCPGSATLVFSPRTGNDIEGSVDVKGNSYSKLPNALRYRKEVTPACTCESQPGDGLANLPINEDSTLKKGDMVVSKTGVRTFKGSGSFPYNDDDFSKPKDINDIRRQ